MMGEFVIRSIIILIQLLLFYIQIKHEKLCMVFPIILLGLLNILV